MVVILPDRSAVMVKTASSDTALDGSFGAIEMQSASAELRVTGEVDGDVTVKSASGDVQLPDVRGHVVAGQRAELGTHPREPAHEASAAVGNGRCRGERRHGGDLVRLGERTRCH